MQPFVTALAIVLWIFIIGGAFCSIDGTDPRYVWNLLVGSRIRHWQYIRTFTRRK